GSPRRVPRRFSASHSVLPQDLVGSLLDVVDSNVRHGREDVAIFEIGKGYGRVADRPHEWWRPALAVTGPAEPVVWNRPARSYDLDDAKGIVGVLAAELGLPAVTFTPDATGYPLHPGRAATADAGTGLV